MSNLKLGHCACLKFELIPENELGWDMWKSFFLAIGFFLLVLGAQTLVVERFAMASGQGVPKIVSSVTDGISSPAAWSPPAVPGSRQTVRRREIRTRDWMPWSLMAAGAITVMYTLSLPQRGSGQN